MPTPGFQTDGPIAESSGNIFDYESSLGESAGASFNRAIDTNPMLQGMLLGRYAYEDAFGPHVDADTARAEIKSRNLPLTVPDQGISRYELDAMQFLKQREIQQQTAMARRSGVLTSAVDLGAGIAGSFTDPINIASGFIPFVPEARYAKWLAEAGSFGERAAIRGGVGAAQGALGALAVEPLVYAGATRNQLNYDLNDSFMNVVFGSLMGGGLHVIGGAFHDWHGLPLEERLARERAAVAPDGVKLEALQSATQSLENDLPVHVEPIFEGHTAVAADNQASPKAMSLNEVAEPNQQAAAKVFQILRDGEAVGDIRGHVEGSDFRIDSMGGEEGPVSLGPAAVRDLGRELRRILPPEIKTISGERVSGARGEAGPDISTAQMRREFRDMLRGRPSAATPPEPENIASIELDRFRPPPAAAPERAAQPHVDPVDKATSVEASTRVKQTQDLETVAADHKFLDAQIDGLKKRDLWKPEDDNAIKAGDEQAQKLSLAAQIYRAAAVCMGE